MRFYIVLFSIIFLATYNDCSAQNYLSFRRKGRNYQQFIPGKEITLKILSGGIKYKISGIIDSIGDNVIFVDGRAAYLQDINAIKIARHAFNYKSGGKNLMGAGVLLSILCYTNKREKKENLPFYIASGILFAGGAAMYLHGERTFEINDKNKLIIIQPR